MLWHSGVFFEILLTKKHPNNPIKIINAHKDCMKVGTSG